MDDIYYKFCDKVENIQRDIDEVDTYLDTIEKLKNSKFNSHTEDAAIVALINNLAAERIALKDRWQSAYDSLLSEADCIVESFNYTFE